MRTAALVPWLLGACAAPLGERWSPPPTPLWPVEVGMTRDELREVWPGGHGAVLDREGQVVDVLWLYSSLQPVVLHEGRVLGFASARMRDAEGNRLHPDLDRFGVGASVDDVREILGSPEAVERFTNDLGDRLEVWSYGRARPRYVFYGHPSQDVPSLHGLAVGFE